MTMPPARQPDKPRTIVRQGSNPRHGQFDFTTLFPGDCLLYFGGTLIDWVIALKTWSKVSHVEIYVGEFEHNGQWGKWSVASRNGIGVGLYPLRRSGLVCVRRTKSINLEAGMKWFWSNANGQGYDWKGLLCFELAVRQGSKTKQFCSEFANRFYKACRRPLFADDWKSDRTPPSFYLVTRMMITVWKVGPLF